MIKIATRIVTPSTQSTRGSPAGWVALKSWKRLRASNTAAQIDNKTCGRQQSGLRVRMNMISIWTYQDFVLCPLFHVVSKPVSVSQQKDDDGRLMRCIVFLKKLATEEGCKSTLDVVSTWVWVGEGSGLVMSKWGECSGLSLKLKLSTVSCLMYKPLPTLNTVPVLPFRQWPWEGEARYKEDDPPCSLRLLSHKAVEVAQQTKLEDWAERVGKGGGSKELSDIEPMGSDRFCAGLKIGVMGER